MSYITKASTFLAKVEKTLDKFGWIQYVGGNEESGFCLSGAVEYVWKQHTDGEHKSTRSCVACRVDEYLMTAISERSIVRWNDDPGRTYPEVKRALKTAHKAAKLDEKKAAVDA